jgi:hypothetical protein
MERKAAVLDTNTLIGLGAHVKTSLGEGFIMGATRSPTHPKYTIRLFDGSLCCAYSGEHDFPQCTNVELIERHPLDHPKLTPSLREFFLKLWGPSINKKAPADVSAAC